MSIPPFNRLPGDRSNQNENEKEPGPLKKEQKNFNLPEKKSKEEKVGQQGQQSKNDVNEIKKHVVKVNPNPPPIPTPTPTPTPTPNPSPSSNFYPTSNTNTNPSSGSNPYPVNPTPSPNPSPGSNTYPNTPSQNGPPNFNIYQKSSANRDDRSKTEKTRDDKKLHPHENKEHTKKKEHKKEEKVEFKQDFEKAMTMSSDQILMQSAGEAKSSEVANVDITKITDIIIKMASQLTAGSINETQITSVELKDSEVPPMFAGSTITLTQSKEGMIIKFENFKSPQQEAVALHVVEKNKEALHQLMRNLHEKNIRVSHMQIGSHHVEVPSVQTSPFFQTPQSGQASEQGRQQQDKDEGDRRQKKDQPDNEEET